jgi:hypothetical protein
MAEPATTTTAAAAGISSLVTLSVAFLGPQFGPYAVIVFAALSGALWPLSASHTDGIGAGAWLLLRCTLTAVFLTGMLAGLAETWLKVPINTGLAPVAMLIGALGNGWRPVFESVGAALGMLVNRGGAGK